MKIEMNYNTCVVTREPGDPTFSGDVNAKGESHLLYHIKKLLNARGYDLIKKRMHKDGHMVDDLQQYLRARKRTGNPDKDIYIYNSNWAIAGADSYLRENGKVTLAVIKDVFKKKEA